MRGVELLVTVDVPNGLVDVLGGRLPGTYGYDRRDPPGKNRSASAESCRA